MEACESLVVPLEIKAPAVEQYGGYPTRYEGVKKNATADEV